MKASNARAEDFFGNAVAISADGNTMAIAASSENGTSLGINGDQNARLTYNGAIGAVFVFVRSATGTWTQQAYVKASVRSNQFGASLSMSSDGNLLVVGAPNNDSSTGSAFVFARSGTTWTEQAVLAASNAELGDLFGSSVAVSGDGSTIVVGAIFESSGATGVNGDQSNNNVTNSGAAYVFARSGTTWTQQAYLKPTSTASSLIFGKPLAITASGNEIAVGAPNTNLTWVGAGAVYLFQRSGTQWVVGPRVTSPTQSGNGNFGNAIALSSTGTTLAVGAPSESLNPNMPDSIGAVHVFTWASGSVTHVTRLQAPSPGTFDLFGESISLSADGTRLAVGAPQEDSSASGAGGNASDNSSSNAGAAYLFTRTATWGTPLYLKSLAPDPTDGFGTAVALSADGVTLVVGAHREDGASVGLGGDPTNNAALNSGAAFVFQP